MLLNLTTNLQVESSEIQLVPNKLADSWNTEARVKEMSSGKNSKTLFGRSESKLYTTDYTTLGGGGGSASTKQ